MTDFRSDRPPGATAASAIVHVPALDGLRGLAIALVMGIHFGVGADLPKHWPGDLSLWLERVCYVGWSGVDLFFVLSGFLITSILIASRDQPAYFRRFYARRALRIFPLYVTALTLALLVLPRAWPTLAPTLLAEAMHEPVWLWTYTLNIANTFGWLVNAGILAQMWSLAIEEQFYAVWPFVVRFLAPRRLAWLCVLLVVMALALRFWWVRVDGLGGWQGAYRFTLTRLDALAAGALLAVLRQDERRWALFVPWSRAGMAVGIAAMLLWSLWGPRFYPDQPGVVTVGHSMLILIFAGLVVEALGPRSPRWMSGRGLTTLGKYSYGLYVWHWPVQYSLITYGQGELGPLTFIGVGLGVSSLLALASYHLLEAPFLTIKNRIGYDAPAQLAET